MNERVSVVMPAYNSACFIRAAIDSCLAQSYPEVEIIVVDDGSTDETVSIVQSYGDAVRLIQQANQGPAIARNTGIDAATGDYIQFCDSDDWLHPEKVARCMAVMQANPDAAIVYSMVRQVVADGESPSGLPDFPPEHYFETSSLFCEILQHGGSPLQTSTLVARKSALNAVGLYRADPDQRCAEDWDLLLRLANDYPIVGVPEVLTYYRHHQGTLSDDPIAMAEGRLQTALYARDYTQRTHCIDDNSYQQYLAGRYHVLGMIYWRNDRHTEARQQIMKALQLTAKGRLMRVLMFVSTFVMSARQFDRILHNIRQSG